MDRPSRSLRKLPARTANNAEKSQERLMKAKRSPTPKRSRSRSRSKGRPKSATRKPPLKEKVKEPEERNASLRKSTRAVPKSTSPANHVSPVPSVITKVKEKFEKVRSSVSPELEAVVRRSLSRFEEVKAEIVSTVRRSGRVGSSALPNNNNASSQQVIEVLEGLDQPKFDFNSLEHRGIEEKKPGVSAADRNVGRLGTALRVLLAVVLIASVFVGHFICTRDDCRLQLSSLPKDVNHRLYFQPQIWLTFSAALILLYFLSRLTVSSHKKPPPFICILGVGCVVGLAGLLWASHSYLQVDLRRLPVLVLLTAVLLHTLLLLTFSGLSSPPLLGSVPLESLILRISAILTLMLNGWVVVGELTRVPPSKSVYYLSGAQAFTAVDVLILTTFSPRPTSGQLHLLWLALKPFIFVLPQIYISANKVALNTYLLVALATLYSLGYALYRLSNTLRTLYLRDPHSSLFARSSVYGEPVVGPWGRVRHPQLTGLALMELSWVLTLAPSLLCLPLVVLVGLAALGSARQEDSLKSRSLKARVRWALIPAVY